MTPLLNRAPGPRFRTLLLAGALLLSLTLALSVGCASKPTMRVRQAQISSVGLLGVGVNVTADVHNPNSFDVMIRHVRATVTMANRYQIGPMDHSPNIWLPAGQATSMTVPVVIPWPLVPPLLAESLGSESVTYRMQGTADVTATRLLGVQVNNEIIDEQGMIPRAMLLGAARAQYPTAQ